ncbi:hypothetical protein [Kitasatospora sp. NPDC093679]|uniref:hypothetical protein n=1 Tax=Kitasatospora sp. NPDC093679 TaxID=3154983 RepID=UPI00343CBD76
MSIESELEEATRLYRQTEMAHHQAKNEAFRAVVNALRAGMRPTDVVKLSPFTAAYVRRIARDHGVGPAKPGPKTSTASTKS